MAKLACPSKGPSIEITIDHDAHADTPSNSYHQKMMIWLTLAEELLINCQAIDIIIKKDRDTQTVFKRATDLSILPVHDPRIDAAPALGVNQPSHAQANTDNLLPGYAAFRKEFFDALHYEV